MGLTEPWLSIGELVDRYVDGSLTASEVIEHTLARIEATEPHLHAYATVSADQARLAASAADEAMSAGRLLGPLHGVPIAVKDLIDTAGIPTEAGSQALAGSIPSQDASVVLELKRAGAIILGKSVTHEFAYGRNTVPTRNAWDRNCYSGGSSAGSAVAVAAGSAYGAIGSDTGGSIRAPASMNGIVGLKPTYGLVNTTGVMPLALSMDVVGPLTRSVSDAARMLAAMTGQPTRFWTADRGTEEKLRVGVDREYFFYEGVESPVAAAVADALDHLANMGHEIISVSIPHIGLSRTVGQTIMVAEASESHKDLLRTSGDRISPETRVMAQLGLLTPAAGYLKAQKVRSVLCENVRSVFRSHRLDVLVGPTIPVTTMPLERWRSSVNAAGESAIASCLGLGMVANVTGLPSLSIPVGFDEDHPIGMQIIGRPFDEGTILGLGGAYERSTPWSDRHPAWFSDSER